MSTRHYWQMQSAIVLFLAGLYGIQYFAPRSANQPPPIPRTPIRVPIHPPIALWLSEIQAQDTGAHCIYSLNTGATWLIAKADLKRRISEPCP